MSALKRFLNELRPLLESQGAQAAYLFGSHSRGDADPHSDIDLLIVAPTSRPAVERFRDYMPAILAAGVGVDLFVYTPEELAEMQREERPFLMNVLAEAKLVYEG